MDSATSDGRESNGDPWVSAGGSLMMALRSNANHFWAWAAAAAPTCFTPELLGHVGIVAGDPHHENFSHVFASGRRVYVMNDFDDSGLAPFFLDFVKFAGVSRSVPDDDSKADVQTMLQQYANGLQARRWSAPLPELLRHDAEVTRDDLALAYAHKIKKHTHDGRFVAEDGFSPWSALSEADRKAFLALEARYFKATLPAGYEIRDRAMFAKSSGGSAGTERYWYYLKRSEDDRHILEFKPIGVPAVGRYRRDQPGPLDRLRESTGVFWDLGVPEPFGILGDARGAYFKRPKYPAYVSLDVHEFRQHPKRFADLSSYIAYRLGTWHGKQPKAAPYVRHVVQHEVELTHTTERVVTDYLKVADAERTRGDRPR